MRTDTYQRARVAGGFCGNCGVRRPKPGCTTCVVCLQAKARTQNDLKAQRRERGLCPECVGLKPLLGVGRERPVVEEEE